MKNIFDAISTKQKDEVFTDLLKCENVRVERIVSYGHSSPESGWYEQNEHEWIMVLQGAAELLYFDQSRKRLKAGDFVLIPAGEKHKVSWTKPSQATVWLAIFFSGDLLES